MDGLWVSTYKLDTASDGRLKYDRVKTAVVHRCRVAMGCWRSSGGGVGDHGLPCLRLRPGGARWHSMCTTALQLWAV